MGQHRPIDSAVNGAIAFLRENWKSNDGAEGESVKLVCDELEIERGTRAKVDHLIDAVMALHFQCSRLRDDPTIDSLCDRVALLALPFFGTKHLQADGIETVAKALLAIPLAQRVEILDKVVQAMPVEEFTSIFGDR